MIMKKECYSVNDKTYRLIHIDEMRDRIALIELFKKSAMPTIGSYLEFIGHIEDKIFLKVSDQYDKFDNKLVDSNLSKKQTGKRDLYFEVIFKAWKESKDELLDRHKRGRIFEQIAEELNVDTRTVERKFSRFWQRGMNRNALLSDSLDSESIRKRNFLNKNGRKPDKYINGVKVTGKIITAEDKKYFEYARIHYQTSKKPSFASTYDWMIRNYYPNEEIVDDSGEIIPDPNTTPTERQLEYYFSNTRSKYEDIIERLGQNYYDLNLRPRQNRVSEYNESTCFLVEIDSTILNVEIKSEHTNEPVGKAIVYGGYLKASKLIPAVYVGYEHDGWMGYAMLLSNLVSDKVKFCGDLGINISEFNWPSHHLPAKIRSDNGPFVGQKASMLLNNYGCELEYAPIARGDLKGGIERFWRTLKDFFRNNDIPGTIHKGKDNSYEQNKAKKNALLTLRDVTKIVVELAIIHNNSVIEGFEIPLEMFTDGVMPIPVEMWHWGVKEFGEPECAFDKDIFKFNILPEVKTKITRDGIIRDDNKMLYTCKEFDDNKWNVSRLGEEMLCKVDPRTSHTIYLLDNEEVIRCYLNPMLNSMKDLSYSERKTYKKSYNKIVRHLRIIKHRKLRILSNDVEGIINFRRKEVPKLLKKNYKKVAIKNAREKEQERINAANSYLPKYFKDKNDISELKTISVPFNEKVSVNRTTQKQNALDFFD